MPANRDKKTGNKVTAKGNPMMLVNFRKELYGILGELERLGKCCEGRRALLVA